MPALWVIDRLAGDPSALWDGLDGDSEDAAAESLIVELVWLVEEMNVTLLVEPVLWVS
jgi:hypothetical protein